MTFLLLLILAHLVADFILKDHKLESNFLFRGIISHGLTVFLTSFLFICAYGLWTAIKITAIIALVHMFVDGAIYLVKPLILRLINLCRKYRWDWLTKQFIIFGKRASWNSLLLRITDQTLHLIVIVYVWSLNNIGIEPNLFNYYSKLLVVFPKLGILKTMLDEKFPLDASLTIGIVYIAVMFGGAVFIPLILKGISPKISQFLYNGTLYHLGKSSKYIGILERAIVLTLVWHSQYGAIALIFTAKSLIRLKETEVPGFAEYYLIGTLISLAIAFLGGLILQNILL